MNPDYDFQPFEGWLGGFIVNRDALAVMLRNETVGFAFAILVLHLVWSSIQGLIRRESVVQIVVGRWLLPMGLWEFYITNYYWFFGPLALGIGELGSKLTGWEALDPVEVLVQGIALSNAILFSSSLITPDLSDYKLFCAALVFVGHVWAAYKVARALIESLILYIIGALVVGLGMSKWTWGSFKGFLKMSYELGVRIVLQYIVLKFGGDSLLTTIDWLESAEFASWTTGLKAGGMGLIYALTVASLPEFYSRRMADGLFEHWGNPFGLNG